MIVGGLVMIRDIPDTCFQAEESVSVLLSETHLPIADETICLVLPSELEQEPLLLTRMPTWHLRWRRRSKPATASP